MCVEAILVANLLDGRPAEIAEIRRYERQHAWRQEAHQTGQRDAQVDVNLREHEGLCLGNRSLQIEPRGCVGKATAAQLPARTNLTLLAACAETTWRPLRCAPTTSQIGGPCVSSFTEAQPATT